MLTLLQIILIIQIILLFPGGALLERVTSCGGLRERRFRLNFQRGHGPCDCRCRASVGRAQDWLDDRGQVQVSEADLASVNVMFKVLGR